MPEWKNKLYFGGDLNILTMKIGRCLLIMSVIFLFYGCAGNVHLTTEQFQKIKTGCQDIDKFFLEEVKFLRVEPRSDKWAMWNTFWPKDLPREKDFNKWINQGSHGKQVKNEVPKELVVNILKCI